MPSLSCILLFFPSWTDTLRWWPSNRDLLKPWCEMAFSGNMADGCIDAWRPCLSLANCHLWSVPGTSLLRRRCCSATYFQNAPGGIRGLDIGLIGVPPLQWLTIWRYLSGISGVSIGLTGYLTMREFRTELLRERLPAALPTVLREL